MRPTITQRLERVEAAAMRLALEQDRDRVLELLANAERALARTRPTDPDAYTAAAITVAGLAHALANLNRKHEATQHERTAA
jgi:hypothetical protein